MVKYKEMYEWEKAAHLATEQELQKQIKLFKKRGLQMIKLRNDLVETTEHYEDMLHELEKQNIEKYLKLKEHIAGKTLKHLGESE